MSDRSYNDADLQVCELPRSNRKKTAQVRKGMVDRITLGRLAELFSVLGDPTRAAILHALTLSELCVCDIAEVVGLSQSAVSHQLRVLRMSRLVKFRKEGKVVYYSLDDSHVRSLMEEGLRHVREGK